jgi:hypothetical protein
MSRRWKIAVAAVVTGLPALLWIAWLASGREVFSKSGKPMEVAVRDELFGDTIVQTRFVRGPLLGYYVGLDLAVAATVAALVAGWTFWRITRRRGRRAAQVDRGSRT